MNIEAAFDLLVIWLSSLLFIMLRSRLFVSYPRRLCHACIIDWQKSR